MTIDWQSLMSQDVFTIGAWVLLGVLMIRHGYALIMARRKLKALRKQQAELDRTIDSETRQLKQLVDVFNTEKDADE